VIIDHDPMTAGDFTVRFMTEAQANTLLKLDLGLHPTDIVCVVQIKGSFSASTGNNPNIRVTYMRQVYIAKTGNLLDVGGSSKAFLS